MSSSGNYVEVYLTLPNLEVKMEVNPDPCAIRRDDLGLRFRNMTEYPALVDLRQVPGFGFSLVLAPLAWALAAWNPAGAVAGVRSYYVARLVEGKATNLANEARPRVILDV